jgi:predicted ArsR family transcriptional regulator
MVANELKVSWNTAQLHLYKLVTEGKVKGRRVGRQNQWILALLQKQLFKSTS